MDLGVLALIFHLHAAFLDGDVGLVPVRAHLRIPATGGVASGGVDSQHQEGGRRLANIEMLVMPHALAGAGQVHAALLPVTANRLVQTPVAPYLLRAEVTFAPLYIIQGAGYVRAHE